MPINTRTILLFSFLCIGPGLLNSSVRVREGHHQTYSRLVFDVPKILQGPTVLTHDTHIVLEFMGPDHSKACANMKSIMQKKMTIVKKVVKVKTTRGCVLQVWPDKRYRLKKTFTLAGQQKDYIRFVMDFRRDQPVKRVVQSKKPSPMVINPGKEKQAIQDDGESQEKKVAAFENLFLKPAAKKPMTPGSVRLKSDVNLAPKLNKAETKTIPYPKLLPKPFRPAIVIDAGHGGHDPGSISCRGVFEKTITLAAAKQIASYLKKSGRYHVKLTRERDIFVPKRKRFAIAREAKADFFISIHADHHPDKTLQGMTIYTLSDVASDQEAARLAKQENSDEFLSGFDFTGKQEPEISNILISLSQTDTANISRQVAKKLHNSITKAKFTKIMSLRFADLAVLKAPDTPSLLIELGYLSNHKNEKLIRSQNFQKKVAEHLLEALDNYFDSMQRKKS